MKVVVREMQAVRIHPKIVAVPQMLEDEECDYLVKLAEGRWKPSTTSISTSFNEGFENNAR